MFKDLQTKGYVVIKNFLTQDEIDTHLNMFKSGEVKSNELYGADVDPKAVPDKLLVKSGKAHQLTDKLQAVLNQISLETDITADVIRKMPLFFDNDVLMIDWHVDHEPYYSTQDSYNNLNFWMPLVKPSSTTSGVSVVPHNVLPPEIKKIVYRTGARRLIADGSKTIIYDDVLGVKHEFEYDLEANAVTPEVGVGDVVIMRSDIIHKSQEPTEHRVAISVRCYNGNAKILRSKFFSGPDFKKNRIGNNIGRYQSIIDCFGRTKAPYVYVRDTVKNPEFWDIVPIKQV